MQELGSENLAGSWVLLVTSHSPLVTVVSLFLRSGISNRVFYGN
jgi:hypothetical protein